MMIKTLIFLALLTTIFLAACKPSTESAIELDGTRWKLQNLEDQQVLPGTTITLEFRGGQMKDSAGCNSYGVDYAIQARNGITFGSIERNIEACLEPKGVMEQEEQYLHSFWTITSYRAEEDRLTLLDEHNEALLQYERRLEFQVNPDNLVDRTWQLVSATGFDEGSLSYFTIRFEGRAFGRTTACRDYAGNYQTSDDHLYITFLQMTTDIECDEFDVGAEGEYTTLLENVEQNNVSPTTLELYS